MLFRSAPPASTPEEAEEGRMPFLAHLGSSGSASS